jgi:hypothetical protein
MIDPPFTVAVLPFLKTSGPVRIGGHLFRSTTDVDSLSPDEAKAVTEIAQMLFVQGDLRVKSASYAVIPSMEIHGQSDRLTQLVHLRAVLSYFYASPHDVFGEIFLHPQETSLVLFVPGPVSVFLTRPEHHTESVATVAGPAPDQRHDVPGYRGLYNFRHYFWLEYGSRLYGLKPHMTLNISQDLRIDFEHRLPGRPDYHLLLAQLDKPLTPAASRIYSALDWFNAANEDGLEPDRALLNLAIAFEALLRLPDSSKTDRLVDAIALLLGRTERLDDWAQQFYAARSQIAHEGRMQDPYFYVRATPKQRQPSDIFGSLMLYGRQVFQLCLATLLVGVELAVRADLEEKLVTNNERYQKICERLKTQVGTPSERLLSIESTLGALKRYRFVATGAVSIGALTGATRYAAAALIQCGHELPQDLGEALATLSAGKREDGELAQLAAVERLYTAFKNAGLSDPSQEIRIVDELVDLAWMTLFPRYYAIREPVPPEQ